MFELKNQVLLLMVAVGAVGSGVSHAACDISVFDKKDGEIVLDSGCVYRGTIRLLQSNTNLKCNGAELKANKGDKYGVFIRGRGLQNVTVSDCKITGYEKAAVMITSGLSGEELDRDRKKSYDLAPKNITLDGLEIKDSKRNGVHFNAYVNHSTLKNSKIIGSRGVGVYLGQSTQNIRIESNEFYANGGVDKAKGYREALAVDSSAKNIIQYNKFSKNAAGSIFLYKNCGENFDRPGAVRRWQSSNDNLIAHNVFSGEKVAVWIASRQSRDLSRWKCGDDPASADGKYFKDYADHNRIEKNVFCRNEVSLRVEGDNNFISDNRFDRPEAEAVDMPYLTKNKPDGLKNFGNRVEKAGLLQDSDDSLCR